MCFLCVSTQNISVMCILCVAVQNHTITIHKMIILQQDSNDTQQNTNETRCLLKTQSYTSKQLHSKSQKKHKQTTTNATKHHEPTVSLVSAETRTQQMHTTLSIAFFVYQSSFYEPFCDIDMTSNIILTDTL